MTAPRSARSELFRSITEAAALALLTKVIHQTHEMAKKRFTVHEALCQVLADSDSEPEDPTFDDFDRSSSSDSEESDQENFCVNVQCGASGSRFRSGARGLRCRIDRIELISE